MKCKREIHVDWNDSKSIKSAERMKSKLENQGYFLEKTNTMGFDKFKLIYVKNRFCEK